MRSEGVRIIYTGLSAALLGQATYTTAHMGNFAVVHTNSLLTSLAKLLCLLHAPI